MHRLEFTRLAARQLDELLSRLETRIEAAISALASNPRPRGSVRMQGRDGTWRIRVGQYRVVYEIHDRVLLIVIIRIGYRRDVYR